MKTLNAEIEVEAIPASVSQKEIIEEEEETSLCRG